MARAGRAPADASVRFGVVGAGSLGFHHLRIARELKGVDLVGFYDVRPERSREVSQALGVRAFEGYEALLAGVDALIVATPTRTHAEVSEVALGRRIHVFIEKPIAATLEEADRILAAADSGVKVQVGHVERFNTAVLGARPYLERPLFIESHRLARFSERGADVAVVLDLMIHDVDLVASLVGSPIEDIQATGVPVLTDSVDIANARIRFRGGGDREPHGEPRLDRSDAKDPDLPALRVPQPGLGVRHRGIPPPEARASGARRFARVGRRPSGGRPPADGAARGSRGPR